MKIVQNPFRGKAGQVVRRLLTEPERHWKGAELARELNLASTWVSRVLSNLARQRLLQTGGRGARNKGTSLLNAKEMLARWLATYSFSGHRPHLYLIQEKDPLQYLDQVAEKIGAQYALTGYVAANLITPVIEKVVPMAYFWPPEAWAKTYRAGLARLENEFRFIPVLKYANLVLLEPYIKEDVFFGRRKTQGIYTVSPLQLFLDLFTMAPERFVIEQLEDYWKENKVPYEL